MTAIDEADGDAFDPGWMQRDLDGVSSFERSLGPTRLGQNAGTVQLAAPVRDVTFGVLHIEINLRVRIRPSELRNGPFEVDGLLFVVRYVGAVMRERRTGTREDEHEGNADQQLAFHFKPPDFGFNDGCTLK